MQFRGSLAALMSAAILTLLTGCGPSTGTVTGQVSVNGQPVDGLIVFSAAETTANAGAPVTAKIENGKYSVTSVVGKKFVQISVPKARKFKDPATGKITDMSDETLPARYNAKTELSFDVQAGSNTKDWALDAKK